MVRQQTPSLVPRPLPREKGPGTHCLHVLHYLRILGIGNYIVITIVERDTRKYHEFIAGYCYECTARVTIPEAMNE